MRAWRDVENGRLGLLPHIRRTGLLGCSGSFCHLVFDLPSSHCIGNFVLPMRINCTSGIAAGQVNEQLPHSMHAIM